MSHHAALIRICTLGAFVASCGTDSDPASEAVAELAVYLTDAPGDFQEVPITVVGVDVHFLGAAVRSKDGYNIGATDDAGDAGEGADDGNDSDDAQNSDTEDAGEEGDAAHAGQTDAGGSADIEGDNSDTLDPERARWIRFDFEEQTWDLLTLRDGVTAKLSAEELPVGYYNEIRVRISEAQVVVDGVAHQVDLSSHAQSGLKYKYKFQITDENDYEIVLDLDAQESIMETENGFRLRPVCRVKQFKGHRRQNRDGSDSGDGGSGSGCDSPPCQGQSGQQGNGSSGQGGSGSSNQDGSDSSERGDDSSSGGGGSSD